MPSLLGKLKKALKKKKDQDSSKEDEESRDKEAADHNQVFHAPSTDEPILKRKKGMIMGFKHLPVFKTAQSR